MKIKRFTAQNFRNIEDCDIEFDDGVNLLIGNNAQGKTNVIEGIYLFSRGRSFRSSDDRDMIRFDTEGFRVGLEYEDKNGDGSLEYACFGRQRLRRKNGYKITRVSEMISSFRSVLFYPDNLELVKDGPDERRAFLNVAVAQCFPTYLDDYTRYKESLENRNKLLKMASKGMPVDDEEICAWSLSMAEYASYIYLKRVEYTELLKGHTQRIGLLLSDGREIIDLEYKGGIDSSLKKREDIREAYAEMLTKNLANEKIVGSTLYGPHRDDLTININGRAARSFASQGQQRSVVLSMKLAEGDVLNEIYGDYPVFLFDDVLSELDERRRSFVIEGMEGRQVIVSCCENDELARNARRIISVEGGRYVSSHR